MAASVIVAVSRCVWPVALARDATPIHVVSAPVSAGPLRGPIVHTGVVRRTAAVTVALPAPALVRSLDVAPHAFVHTGDVLARVDRRAFSQPLARAQAELDQATAELAAQQSTLQGAEGDAASLERPDDAGVRAGWTLLDESIRRDMQDIGAATERVQRAAANVARIEEQMQQADVRAPIAGWIATIDREASLLTIVPDADHVEAAGQLDARIAGTLRIGGSAIVRTGSWSARGVVVHVEPDAVEAERTVVVDVAASAHELMPGEPVTIELESDRSEPVVRVPTAALAFTPSGDVLIAAGEGAPPEITLRSRSEGASRVWLFDGNRFVAIEVRTGAGDGQFTEIVDGAVRPGDQVVTDASVADAARQ